jgi:hypothetical protein
VRPKSLAVLLCAAALASLPCHFGPAVAQDKEKPKEKKKEADKPPAGTADVLRKLPKKFARFLAADAKGPEVKLHVEGETEPKTWRVSPDAEIKVRGWWGRLEQFQPEQRVWVWFDLDRKQQPRGILMIADEISEQDIHGQPRVLQSVDPKQRTVTVKPPKGDAVTLKLAPEISLSQAKEDFEFAVTIGNQKLSCAARGGDRVYVQSFGNPASGDMVRVILDADGLKATRRAQQDWLRERWRKEGLPGTVTFLHRLGGEMEIMLDHEAIRWGRYLKNGDNVTLAVPQPIAGRVISATPWRERTNLRLVVGGLDQADLALGQRLPVKVPEPPEAVQSADLPSDIGRPRSRSERVEWFLASVYCPCKIGGDGCTGMFYTLASCNTHGCALPNQFRNRIEGLIDQGLSDQQIYAELRKAHGPTLTMPHLLP